MESDHGKWQGEEVEEWARGAARNKVGGQWRRVVAPADSAAPRLLINLASFSHFMPLLLDTNTLQSHRIQRRDSVASLSQLK